MLSKFISRPSHQVPYLRIVADTLVECDIAEKYVRLVNLLLGIR